MGPDAADGGLIVAELLSDRHRPPEQWAALFAGGWPAFIDADEVAARCLPRVRAAFGHLEVALTQLALTQLAPTQLAPTQLAPTGTDGADRPPAGQAQVVAAAWGVPIAWEGRPEHLPTGYSDALVRALADDQADAPADTLVVCAAQVHPDLRDRGLAPRLLTHLIEVGDGIGLRRAVAPLRPGAKTDHPLTPIDDYAGWARRDGAAFDPWLRTHLRMGASVVRTVEASQTFTGTREQWEAWSKRSLPGNGRHVIDGALAPLEMDGDHGVLVEPGIWVRHR